MRKPTDLGVSEEQRFEYCVLGKENVREGTRDCDSMSATLRPAVEGLAPIYILATITQMHQHPNPQTPNRSIKIWNIRKAPTKLKPAGPPPTQTTSKISGFVGSVEVVA